MSLNCVYVGNLSYRTAWYELKDYMRTAGDVVHAKIMTTHSGQSRGCGVVEFSSPEDAQRAIDELNGTELNGRVIFVREDRGPPAAGNNGDGSNSSGPNAAPAGAASGAAAGEKPETRGFALFVANLPFSVHWMQLKELFSQAGEVLRADVHLSGTGNRSSRGHGTVVFATEEGAANAIAQFNGYELEGRVLEVREDVPASARPLPFLWCSALGDPSDTVYIANLPWSTTESDLIELFQSIGPLSRSHLQTFPDGSPSGNAVVRYESAEDAQRAVDQLNNYSYGSRALQVSFARYPPKSL